MFFIKRRRCVCELTSTPGTVSSYSQFEVTAPKMQVFFVQDIDHIDLKILNLFRFYIEIIIRQSDYHRRVGEGPVCVWLQFPHHKHEPTCCNVRRTNNVYIIFRNSDANCLKSYLSELSLQCCVYIPEADLYSLPSIKRTRNHKFGAFLHLIKNTVH